MPDVPIGIAGPTYRSPSTTVDNQRTMNWYPEAVDDPTGKGLARIVLVPTPGLVNRIDRTSDSGSGPARGLLEFEDKLITVLGENVYVVEDGDLATNTPTQRGSISNTTNAPVDMFAGLNGQVMIVSDKRGYVLDTTGNSNIAEVTDPDFPDTISAAFSDQYAVALQDSDQELFVSSAGNFTEWDALEFGVVESAEDEQIAIIANRREIWAFGKKLTNIYFNSANIDFPFDRRSGGVYEFGCAAKNSIALSSKMGMKWLGSDRNGTGVVLNASGYSAERISDHALEAQISKYSRIDDAVGFAQQWNGHEFYWLWFPTANATWVYDDLTSMWHERGLWNGATYEAHFASCHGLINNKHIVGDRRSAILYEMRTDAGDDDGTTIRRFRRTPHLIKSTRLGRSRHSHKALRLVVDIGDNPGAGNPMIGLRYSNDSGRTWSNIVWKNYGATVSKGLEVEWRRLGSSNKLRTYEVITQNNVPAWLVNAYLDIE